MGEGRVIKFELRNDLAPYIYPPPPASPKPASELNIWTVLKTHRQTPYALNDFAQLYLPMREYRKKCFIHTYQYSLCFVVTSSLGFEISSAWTSNIEFASYMEYILPHT